VIFLVRLCVLGLFIELVLFSSFALVFYLVIARTDVGVIPTDWYNPMAFITPV